MQTIKLIDHVGQEQSLQTVAKIALETLGGSLDHPLSEADRRRYSNGISRSKLRNRLRNNSLKIMLVSGLAVSAMVLLSPIIILVYSVFLFGVLFWLWIELRRDPD